MLGISLDTWVKVAAIVAGGIVIIIGNRTHVNKVVAEMREDRRKRQAEAEERKRKHQAELREILARKLAEDDSPQEPAR